MEIHQEAQVTKVVYWKLIRKHKIHKLSNGNVSGSKRYIICLTEMYQEAKVTEAGHGGASLRAISRTQCLLTSSFMVPLVVHH